MESSVSVSRAEITVLGDSDDAVSGVAAVVLSALPW